MKEKAAEKYRSGEITISKAAEIAETTIWDMERYLVENGYVYEYLAKDLMDELENL